MRIAAFTVLVVLAGLPIEADAYTPGAVADGGQITGTVRFSGKTQAAPNLAVTKDESVCGAEPMRDEGLIVAADKGLANAIVFLEKVDHGKPLAPGTAELANRICRYHPHVQAFVTGTELQVRNDDPVLHNTHIKLPRSDVFNYALPQKGQVIKKKVTRPGLMKVGCDAGHTWMSAWIAVFDHPYFAVTGADGRFALTDVPAGSYNLVFWHEKLGKVSQPVVVQAGAATEASHSFP